MWKKRLDGVKSEEVYCGEPLLVKMRNSAMIFLPASNALQMKSSMNDACQTSLAVDT
jgi:hypothetical protein